MIYHVCSCSNFVPYTCKGKQVDLPISYIYDEIRRNFIMGKKRGNGEGTIFQRKDRRWCASYFHDEKRYFVYGSSYDEVAQKLLEKQSDIVRDEFIAPNQQTVAQWLRFYINEIASIKMRLTTYKINYDHMENHIIPALGKYRLQDPRLRDYIQLFVNDQHRKGFATSSIKRQMAVLKPAFKEAVIRQYIFRNPTEYIVMPKMNQKDIEFLSQKELQQLLPFLPKNTSGNALRFILGTGLRVGEVCALRWCDVDKQSIHVRQTTSIVNFQGESQRVTNPPKTKNGARQIPLNSGLYAILQEQKERQHQEKTIAGAKWKGIAAGVGQQFVFATSLGTPSDRDNLGRTLRSSLKKAGLNSRGVHALRHPYVKPTTKYLFLQKQKSQTTNYDLMAWFSVFVYYAAGFGRKTLFIVRHFQY